jgi:hypothetical protein
MSLRLLKLLYWGAREGTLDWRALVSDCPRQLSVFAKLAVSYTVLRLRAALGSARAQPFTIPTKRLLVISYYAPPYRSVFGTQRLAKFIKYLSKWGWAIELITTAPVAEREIDNRAEQLPASVNVVRLEQSESQARFISLIPDRYIGWVAPALEAGRQRVRMHRPSAIVATVPPYTNAIVAALLSAETGLPLIVDFRDPWTKIDTGWVIANRGLRWLSGLMERAILDMSSALVMADEARYAKDFFVRCGSKVHRKVSTVLNGYDDEDFLTLSQEAQASAGDKFIISYVGTFYDAPTFINVKRAFERWHSTFPGDLQDVELHYAGPQSAFFDRYAFRLPYVRDHGYVSHREAIAIRAASHLQIFSQPPSFKAHVISGKVYEMMRVPVPIIAFTNPAGTVARFIEETGTGVVVSNAEPEAATIALHHCYSAWKEGRAIVTRNDQAIGEFSRENQTKQLEAIIERVIR